MKTLHIDTTGKEIVLKLEVDGGSFETKRATDGDTVDHLVPEVKSLLESKGLKVADLGEIKVNRGPGAWSGTRIGVVTAKMLAWAAGVKIEGGLDVVPEYPDDYESTLDKKFETV